MIRRILANKPAQEIGNLFGDAVGPSMEAAAHAIPAVKGAVNNARYGKDLARSKAIHKFQRNRMADIRQQHAGDQEGYLRALTDRSAYHEALKRGDTVAKYHAINPRTYIDGAKVGYAQRL